MINLFGKTRWALFDCVNRRWAPIEKLPFEIGASDGVDLRLEGEGIRAKHGAIHRVRGFGLCFVRRDPTAELTLNGDRLDTAPLKPRRDYALRIGAQLWALRGGRSLDRWREALETADWRPQEIEENGGGGLNLSELCEWGRGRPHPDAEWVRLGETEVAFTLLDLLTACGVPPTEAPALDGEAAPSESEDATRWTAGMGDAGELLCPVCWLRFDEGDIMHVATHESLRGDPVLGEEVPQRFHATRFNDRGHALDAFGLPCPEIACPHCRRVLPSGFLETPHHIFSIVGDQGAGKSYYLSVLVKLLPLSLYKHFHVRFQDADPAGNAPLNEMKKTLFSAQSPAEARLAKTQLEGAMYERLPRYGRIVALPKPFVFYLESMSRPGRRGSVIFYDNAGEHFQPGRDSADSPGAQHVASSSGILFLFDPFNQPDFRARLADREDPQSEQPIVDQQDVVLAEMKARLVKLLRLQMSDRLEAPLAVLVGKCDVWMHLLGEAPLANPLREGRLRMDLLDQNSARVRDLLLEICPSVVANAESVCQVVRYFPVSSFGHSPVRIGEGEYVPDPRRLNPILVEIPPLWILSRVLPELGIGE